VLQVGVQGVQVREKQFHPRFELRQALGRQLVGVSDNANVGVVYFVEHFHGLEHVHNLRVELRRRVRADALRDHHVFQQALVLVRKISQIKMALHKIREQGGGREMAIRDVVPKQVQHVGGKGDARVGVADVQGFGKHFHGVGQRRVDQIEQVGVFKDVLDAFVNDDHGFFCGASAQRIQHQVRRVLHRQAFKAPPPRALAEQEVGFHRGVVHSPNKVGVLPHKRIALKQLQVPKPVLERREQLHVAEGVRVQVALCAEYYKLFVMKALRGLHEQSQLHFLLYIRFTLYV
jgi:hypothetical protein